MIGAASFWPKALFVLAAFGFSSALYSAWREVLRKNARVTGKLLLMSAFIGLWIFIMLQLFVREAMFHWDLWRLQAEAVETVQIGSNTISDREGVSNVVYALNHARWFSPNHGGWGEEVSFTVHLKSGRHLDYHIAQYLRQPGAVLTSMADSGRSDGEVFCPDLPTALATNNISLPGSTLLARPSAVVTGRESGATSNWSGKLLPAAIFGFFWIVSLTAIYQIVFQDGLTPARFPIQQKWLSAIIGLPLATMIAAASTLRLAYVFFNWPDPTNGKLIIGVWLVVLATGVVLLMLRSRKVHPDLR